MKIPVTVFGHELKCIISINRVGIPHHTALYYQQNHLRLDYPVTLSEKERLEVTHK